MIYLRSFNENKALYTEISNREYDKAEDSIISPFIDIPTREINRIKGINLDNYTIEFNPKNFMYPSNIKIIHNEWMFDKKYNPPVEGPKYKGSIIFFNEDEYYYVKLFHWGTTRLHGPDDYSSFKCDQFEGLISLLKDSGIN